MPARGRDLERSHEYLFEAKKEKKEGGRQKINQRARLFSEDFSR